MREVKKTLSFMLGFMGCLVFLFMLVYAFADGMHRFNKDALAPSGAQPDAQVYMSVEDAENTLPPTFCHE